VSAILITIHIITCFILIIAVLLQSGKAADLAGAFGGGGSQTVFGPRGAGNILSKVTTICAILFMVTSLGLWMLSARGSKSAFSGEQEKPAVTETEKKEPEAKPPATEQKQEKEQTAPETEKKAPEKKD
jgi:preprotein translocase subunit SecG